MRIAIISDIHNNEINLKKVLDYCRENKIEKIICCGDLASKETLDFLNDNFSGEIFYTFGNMDNDQLAMLWHSHPERSEGSRDITTRFFANAQNDIINYKNTKIFKDFGEAEIENCKVAFTHYPEEAEKLAKTKKYNFVFHGHTHKPEMKKIENCIILNPGNVANEIYLPTFAVWNTEDGKFELIRVNEL